MRYSSINESDFAISVNVVGFYIAMVSSVFVCELLTWAYYRAWFLWYNFSISVNIIFISKFIIPSL